MKNVSKILVVAALFIGSVSCYAQRPNNGGQKPNPEMVFKMLDSNKDDKISLDEAKKARGGKLVDNFKMFDANNDGFIEVTELKDVFTKRKSAGNKKR